MMVWGGWLLVWVSEYAMGISSHKRKAILQVKRHDGVGFLEVY
jgi:hypothetical protein